MISLTTFRLALASLLIPGVLNAQSIQLLDIKRDASSVTVQWKGGNGPFLVETSPNLTDWSDQGEPITNRQCNLISSLTEGFYRVRDLNASNQIGSFYGLLQTDQGEFGELFGRHRLKSRWWLHKPAGTLSKVPAEFFRKLIVHYQYVDNGKVTTFAGPLETLGTTATPGNAKQMTVAWTRGSGSTLRQFSLTLDFPYAVNTARTAEPYPSDPVYQLKCNYAEAQPEPDFYLKTVETTKTDSIKLIQIDPAGPAEWMKRNYSVKHTRVTISLAYDEGNYMYQGDPLFILKTYVLHGWTGPTSVSSSSLPTFSTDSYFSRTLMPFHHNFIENVLIEPGLDPSINKAVLKALAAANIRYIYTFKDFAFGMSPDDVLYVGFDNKIFAP